jgi:hypothetical protein
MSKKSLLIRFQKLDQYDNPIFIANAGDESYEDLKKYSKKIADLSYDTFSPIYYASGFELCTIRFKKSQLPVTLKKNNVYSITYAIKTIERNDKKYVNCIIKKIKLIKKAIIVSEGEDLFMD